MTSIQHALRRIDKVLESDFDPSSAYPLRARLGRAVLASTNSAEAIMKGRAGWVASRSSAAADPANTTAPDELATVLARLNSAAAHIMQPSEPFDSHWREQWAEVLNDLRHLRHLLGAAKT